MHPNLRQAMLASGWAAIDTRTDPRAYADASGKRFGTLTKDGVRVALSIGEELMEDRGEAMVYSTEESTDVIVRALIVDSDLRRQGVAVRTLAEITKISDANGYTLYLEPAPIDDKPLDSDALARLYARFAFAGTSPRCRVMVRPPGGAPTKA